LKFKQIIEITNMVSGPFKKYLLKKGEGGPRWGGGAENLTQNVTMGGGLTM
jgi:hypothetical protein